MQCEPTARTYSTPSSRNGRRLNDDNASTKKNRPVSLHRQFLSEPNGRRLGSALCGDQIEPYSAGIEVRGLDANAVKVMAEAGVDIAGQKSKNVQDLAGVRFDYVITVCGHANETCPIFPGHSKKLHVGFDDPPLLAKSATSPDEALGHYRRVRDEIREFVTGLPALLV